MNDDTPLVIVRTVAHNASATIARTIESIQAQTYQNWEFHMVNNGSTDETGNIMADYAKKDPRLKILKNDENWVWKKGNRLTDYYHEYDIKNTYWAHIDADDEYKPEFLKKMLAFSEEYNLDIAVCGHEHIDSLTNEVMLSFVPEEIYILEGETFDTLFPIYHFLSRSRWGKLFKLSLTDKLDTSNTTQLRFGDDNVESMEYYLLADKVGYYPASYYKYYKNHGSNLSFSWSRERNDCNKVVHDLTLQYLEKKTGHISLPNLLFAHLVYNNEVGFTISIINDSDLTDEMKLFAIHDIITCEQTRKLTEITLPDNIRDYIHGNELAQQWPAENYNVLTMAMNWVQDNFEKYQNERYIKMLLEIIPVLEKWQESIDISAKA